MKENRFWMVWNPNGREPAHKHLSKQAADTEADRLAGDNPGQVFYVLKATHGRYAAVKPAKKIRLKTIVDLDSEIPF